MKIYFEDGELRDVLDEIPCKINLILDATKGYSCCDSYLYNLSMNYYNAVIYTNMITALSNKYAWNEKLKVSEIYLRNKNNDWIRIDKLTQRILREGHNIMRMYMAGEFEER